MMAVSRQMSLGNSVFSYLQSMLNHDSPQEVYKSDTHSCHILRGLRENYEEGNFLDVTLVVDGKEIRAHKIVLASFSLYFKGVFNRCWKESENEIYVIQDIDESTLRCVLNFAYSSELEINTNNVLNLLAAADFLQVDFVKTSCCVYLKTLVNEVNCLAMLFFADKFNASELESYLVQYAARYFHQVSQSDDFLDLPEKLVIRLLQSECLIVDKGQDFLPSVAEQESAVLESVLRYASHQSESKPELLVDLLHNVRLLLLSPSYLDGLIHSNEDLSDCPVAKELITRAIDSLNHSDDKVPVPELWSTQREATKMSESICKVHACGYVRTEQSFFNDDNLVPESDAYLTGMRIWVRRWDGRPVIGGMCIYYNNGKSSMNGGQDATSEVEEFHLPNAERIVKVDIRSGWMIDSLQFHTNKGRVFGPYGGPGGSLYTEEPKASFGYLGYVKGAVVLSEGKLGITRLGLVWRNFMMDSDGGNDVVHESSDFDIMHSFEEFYEGSDTDGSELIQDDSSEQGSD